MLNVSGVAIAQPYSKPITAYSLSKLLYILNNPCLSLILLILLYSLFVTSSRNTACLWLNVPRFTSWPLIRTSLPASTILAQANNSPLAQSNSCFSENVFCLSSKSFCTFFKGVKPAGIAIIFANKSFNLSTEILVLGLFSKSASVALANSFQANSGA